MRKIMVFMVTAALLFMPPAVWAQQPDIKPATVILKVNETDLLATCKGLNVRITSNKDDFQSHSFFISRDDLEALAKKRGIPCAYDGAAKKLKLGKTTADVIAPDPKSRDSFAFGKVRMVTYGGKPYFDVVGLWLGLGFDTFRKLNDGFNFTEGRAKKTIK